MLVNEAAPFTDDILLLIRRQIQIDTHRRGARHVHSQENMLRVAKSQSGFLECFTLDTRDRIRALPETSNDFKRLFEASGIKNWRSKLPHENGCAPYRIVGQHAYRVSVIFNLAGDNLTVFESNCRNEEFSPSIVYDLNLGYLDRHVPRINVEN